jgi:hypothetical protein
MFAPFPLKRPSQQISGLLPLTFTADHTNLGSPRSPQSSSPQHPVPGFPLTHNTRFLYTPPHLKQVLITSPHQKINGLGTGPQGLGGIVTALDVHIETFPKHIGSLLVAVNIQCHSCRHKEALLP